VCKVECTPISTTQVGRLPWDAQSTNKDSIQQQRCPPATLVNQLKQDKDCDAGVCMMQTYLETTKRDIEKYQNPSLTSYANVVCKPISRRDWASPWIKYKCCMQRWLYCTYMGSFPLVSFDFVIMRHLKYMYI